MDELTTTTVVVSCALLLCKAHWTTDFCVKCHYASDTTVSTDSEIHVGGVALL